MGFAAHFAALAYLASGDHDTARARFEHAIALSSQNGAALWEAHSSVELAGVLARSDERDTIDEARRLLDALRRSPITLQSARLSRRVDEVSRAVRGVG
jgi:hypothetical protein